MTTSRDGRLALTFAGVIALAAAVLVALVAAGVFDSEHEVDEAAWQATLERELVVLQGPGHQDVITNWAQYRDVWLDVCDDDDSELSAFLAVGLDEGNSYEYLRTNLQYACPDRLPVLDDVRENGDQVDQACETSPEQRTEEQAQLAEAMGC